MPNQVTQPNDRERGVNRFTTPAIKINIRIQDRALVGAVRAALHGKLAEGTEGTVGGIDYALYRLFVVSPKKNANIAIVNQTIEELKHWTRSTQDKLKSGIAQMEAVLKHQGIEIPESTAGETTLTIHTPYAREFVEIFKLFNTTYERAYLLWVAGVLSDEQFSEEKRKIIRQCHRVGDAVGLTYKKVKRAHEEKNLVPEPHKISEIVLSEVKPLDEAQGAADAA